MTERTLTVDAVTFTREDTQLIATVDGCKLQTRFDLNDAATLLSLLLYGPRRIAHGVTRAMREVEADFESKGQQALDDWNACPDGEAPGATVEAVPQ